MNAWGNGLYQNDIALDVRDTLEAALDDGKAPKEAIDEFIEARFPDFSEWERAVATLAIADTMLSRGFISEEMRKYGLEQIRWFELCGLEKNDMMGDALRDLKQRLEVVPHEVDAEKLAPTVLEKIELDEEEPQPIAAGRFGWIKKIKESITGRK